ncbi:MAG: L-threonylcarbamoyladenylate synthase [bacterium]
MTPLLDPSDTRAVVDRIRDGQVFVYPTDTAYGLGASLDSTEAVRRVFRIKQRSLEKSVPVLTDRQTALRRTSPPGPVRTAVDEFWPGALTLVLSVENPSEFPPGTTRNGTLALREPAYMPLVKILSDAGMITGTSANLAGEATPGSIDEISPSLREAVDFILSGPEVDGQGSTVAEWDAGSECWQIHRKGPITREQLTERTLGSTREE